MFKSFVVLHLGPLDQVPLLDAAPPLADKVHVLWKFLPLSKQPINDFLLLLQVEFSFLQGLKTIFIEGLELVQLERVGVDVLPVETDVAEVYLLDLIDDLVVEVV